MDDQLQFITLATPIKPFRWPKVRMMMQLVERRETALAFRRNILPHPWLRRLVHRVIGMPDEAHPLLVFFSSPSSGPSRRMESLVAHIAHKERHRLRVLQVDVGERADLVEQLAVSHVPTLVLVVARKAVARIDGRASAPKIEAMLAKHFAVCAV